MATNIKRKYNNKDIEMLTATSTIIENAIANKTFLQTKRSTWANSFFEDLKTENENVTETYLGKDAAKQMRDATQIILGIQKQALIDLAEFKVQVEEDFKDNAIQKTEILKNLGFTDYHKSSQKSDQEGLVNLLFQFKTNMTAILKAEIVAKGTAEITINNIVDYAGVLKNANINQETFKGTRKEITDQAITAFNEIYDRVISIAKISSNFYKSEKTKQQLFSYAKVSANLNNQKVK